MTILDSDNYCSCRNPNINDIETIQTGEDHICNKCKGKVIVIYVRDNLNARAVRVDAVIKSPKCYSNIPTKKILPSKKFTKEKPKPYARSNID